MFKFKSLIIIGTAIVHCILSGLKEDNYNSKMSCNLTTDGTNNIIVKLQVQLFFKIQMFS